MCLQVDIGHIHFISNELDDASIVKWGWKERLKLREFRCIVISQELSFCEHSISCASERTQYLVHDANLSVYFSNEIVGLNNEGILWVFFNWAVRGLLWLSCSSLDELPLSQELSTLGLTKARHYKGHTPRVSWKCFDRESFAID